MARPARGAHGLPGNHIKNVEGLCEGKKGKRFLLLHVSTPKPCAGAFRVTDATRESVLALKSWQG